ncbi:AAA family ATPase (plasmid) [Comamonas aquatica]|nr:AAA family ATPase [Comamonas aquatica]
MLFNLFKKSKPASRHGKPSNCIQYSTSNCISHQYPTLDVPDFRFSDLKGMLELKRQVVDACKEITASWRAQEFNKNGVLFYGGPGNGKTAIGRAIAGSYGWPFFEIKAATLISQWVGETPRGIRESFDFVKRNSPCVLMLDELDSFLSDVSNKTSEDKLDVRNTLLTELESIRSYSVIVVGATNYFDRLNPAAVREGRFDFKIEVKSPDMEARKQLISQCLKNLPSDEILNIVAKRYAGFSVKRVMAVAQGAQAIAGAKKIPTIEDFSNSLRKLQGTKGNALRDVPGLNQLCFNTSVAKEVSRLVSELTSVDKLLRYGAFPFKGALFVGPAGTGKTALAKAIAKDSGWAFLEVAGPDLLADYSKLEEIQRKALEIRPCVIFIDEASELVKNREHSPHSSFTNKLLTVIDGFGEPVPDVVYLVATNHGDDIDEAIARRLYRRIDFELPHLETRERLVRLWATRNEIARDVVTQSAREIAHRTDGLSAANLNNWLDTRFKNEVVHAINNNVEPNFLNAFT